MKIYPSEEIWVSHELRNKCSTVEPATIGHYLDFGFMDPKIKSLLKNVRVIGQALTVRTTANDSVMVHKAASMVREGEVIVIDRSSDSKHACVGEMVAYAANTRKAAGIIIDGPATDIQAIREINIPVFATGLSPITTKLKGFQGEINSTIQCGGVAVHPGDFILADDNGVLVLPKKYPKLGSLIEKSTKSEARESINKQKLDSGTVLAQISNANKILRDHKVID